MEDLATDCAGNAMEGELALMGDWDGTAAAMGATGLTADGLRLRHDWRLNELESEPCLIRICRDRHDGTAHKSSFNEFSSKGR